MPQILFTSTTLQNFFGGLEDKKEMTSIQKQLFIVAGVFGVLILILILLVLALAVAVARLANQLKVSIILVQLCICLYMPGSPVLLGSTFLQGVRIKHKQSNLP